MNVSWKVDVGSHPFLWLAEWKFPAPLYYAINGRRLKQALSGGIILLLRFRSLALFPPLSLFSSHGSDSWAESIRCLLKAALIGFWKKNEMETFETKLSQKTPPELSLEALLRSKPLTPVSKSVDQWFAQMKTKDDNKLNCWTTSFSPYLFCQVRSQSKPSNITGKSQAPVVVSQSQAPVHNDTAVN